MQLLLDLLAWLLLVAGLAVIAGTVWLAFETKHILLPWKPAKASGSKQEKRKLDLQRDREQDLAGAGPVN
jgi:hypothetical protein